MMVIATEEIRKLGIFNIDADRYRVIDISYLVVPGQDPDRPFDMTRGYLADNSYKFDISCTHTHVGTHIESSSHFFDDGITIDKYPLNAFFGRGVLLDVDLPHEKYITSDYIDSKIGDIISDNDIVVCRNVYDGTPDCKRYFAEDAACYLRDKNVKMIVLGSNVSMGENVDSGRRFHEILMRNTTFLEIVSNLDQISKPEFFVMAMPVLIKGIDSAWCRAIVVEEK